MRPAWPSGERSPKLACHLLAAGGVDAVWEAEHLIILKDWSKVAATGDRQHLSLNDPSDTPCFLHPHLVRPPQQSYGAVSVHRRWNVMSRPLPLWTEFLTPLGFLWPSWMGTDGCQCPARRDRQGCTSDVLSPLWYAAPELPVWLAISCHWVQVLSLSFLCIGPPWVWKKGFYRELQPGVRKGCMGASGRRRELYLLIFGVGDHLQILQMNHCVQKAVHQLGFTQEIFLQAASRKTWYMVTIWGLEIWDSMAGMLEKFSPSPGQSKLSP